MFLLLQHFTVFIILIGTYEARAKQEDAMRVLQSTLTVEQDNQFISGAKVVSEKMVDMEDFSLCIR